LNEGITVQRLTIKITWPGGGDYTTTVDSEDVILQDLGVTQKIADEASRGGSISDMPAPNPNQTNFGAFLFDMATKMNQVRGELHDGRMECRR
jgi:hypothetical protein